MSKLGLFAIKALWISQSKSPRDGVFQSFVVIHRVFSISTAKPLYLVLTINPDSYM